MSYYGAPVTVVPTTFVLVSMTSAQLLLTLLMISICL